MRLPSFYPQEAELWPKERGECLLEAAAYAELEALSADRPRLNACDMAGGLPEKRGDLHDALRWFTMAAVRLDDADEACRAGCAVDIGATM